MEAESSGWLGQRHAYRRVRAMKQVRGVALSTSFRIDKSRPHARTPDTRADNHEKKGAHSHTRAHIHSLAVAAARRLSACVCIVTVHDATENSARPRAHTVHGNSTQRNNNFSPPSSRDLTACSHQESAYKTYMIIITRRV